MPKESDELTRLAADVRVAAFRLTRRLRIESDIDDLTDTQMTVVMRLGHAGPATLGQLAEFERVSAPSMNRTVNALAAKGLVRRTSDPSDGRRVIMELTDAGSALASTARARRSAWLTAAIEPLTPDDRAALARAAALIERMLAP